MTAIKADFSAGGTAGQIVVQAGYGYLTSAISGPQLLAQPGHDRGGARDELGGLR